MATSLILLRLFYHFGAYRIQVNISHQTQKISITVTKKRLIPPLKEMTHFIILSIEVLGVGEVYTLHDLRESDIGSFNK